MFALPNNSVVWLLWFSLGALAQLGVVTQVTRNWEPSINLTSKTDPLILACLSVVLRGLTAAQFTLFSIRFHTCKSLAKAGGGTHGCRGTMSDRSKPSRRLPLYGVRPCTTLRLSKTRTWEEHASKQSCVLQCVCVYLLYRSKTS